MKIEHKTFEFKVEDASTSKAGEGIIRGFASTFGNIDLGDDVVDQGAFKKTIKESKGLIPILADHDPSKQIGWNLRAEETESGLFVEGKINLESPLGRERYALAKQGLEIGAKSGLSIGYGVIKAMPDKDRPSVRRLKELKLYEYSLVTFPMNTDAMLTSAKTWMDEQVKVKGLDVEQVKLALEIVEKAKTLGVNPMSILQSLHDGADGILAIDPTIASQSIERIIKSLK